ncbi:MAG: RNA polymerase factor sigma-54 [Tissierellia bacterium]|nr:RNA polymerase factor sigma-54 [Tissierellia bacterium]
MQLDMNLVLEQKQQLILTPALKLSLDILQDNSLELKERIEEEVLENPLLEIRENSPLPRRNLSSYSPWDDLEDRPSLAQYLLEQVSFLELSSRERNLVERLIEYVNRKGYLLEEYLKDAFFSSYDKEEMEKALWVLQHLKPAGVGSRNLTECLILQLRDLGYDTSVALDIVSEDLEDVAAHRLDKLAKKYDISLHAIEEAIRRIQTLDPKPGLAFHKSDRVNAQIADVIIEKNQDKLELSLNERIYPDVMVSPYYSNLSLEELDDKSKVYISDKKKRAQLFLEALMQRRKTITNVMNSIMEFQKDFFTIGEKGMVPLNLLDVADQIDCHESTISRAINGKFLLFENQLYPLSYFFPSAVGTEQGRNVSSLHVKSIIEDLVENENKAKPYSDDALAKKVEEQGIFLARRTIAKYREELGILSSILRKNFK